MTSARESAVVPVSEWRWFGRAAHFICAGWCRFHLATEVGDFVVSTVGEYLPIDSVQTVFARVRGFPLTLAGEAREAEFIEKNGGYEDIGLGRKFETGVFRAGEPCTAKGCDCGQRRIVVTPCLHAEGYSDAKAATEGHYRVCEMAARGEIVVPPDADDGDDDDE
ncbi:MAG: hypothetical protein ABSD03_12405 [Vulcanimicrobiaceae bacterium]|jgi:hypothetical protein